MLIWRLWIGFVCLCTLSSHAHAAEVIRLNGTGAAISIMQKLATAFEAQQTETKVQISLPVTGSGGGIKGLLQGALDIGVSARPLKAKEQAQGLQQQAFAKTPFVFAVAETHTSKDNFSFAALTDIYAGKIRRWSDGSRMRLVLRPLKDSDTVLLQKLSPEMKAAIEHIHGQKGYAIAITDQDSADMIERVQGSIGTSLLSLIIAEQRPLRTIAIDGVMPSVEAMQSGEYPYSKTFHWVVHAKPKPAVQQFLDFLQTPQAIDILKNNGCEPLI